MDKTTEKYLEELTFHLKNLPDEIVQTIAKYSLHTYQKRKDPEAPVNVDPDFEGKKLDVTVLNILELAKDLKEIKRAVEKSKVSDISIKNFPTKQKVQIINFKELELKLKNKILTVRGIQRLLELTEKIADKDPKIEIKMPETTFPTEPRDAIPVVLTTKEKKQFYNAWFSGGGGGANIPALSTLNPWDITIVNANKKQVLFSTDQMSIEILADEGNGGIIYVGNSANQLFPLRPNASKILRLKHASLVWIRGDNDGDVAHIIGGKE